MADKDKHELLHLPQPGSSLLNRSEAHSGLIARGLIDAASLLVRRAEPTLPETVTDLTVIQGHDADALFNLGEKYYYGESVQQDYAQAETCYHKAANHGNADAQYSLGVMYDKGLGVPQDYAQAAVWYHMAADQGHAGAQYNLALAYAMGEGVPQDNAQAIIWFRKAADQGLSDAQHILGVTPRLRRIAILANAPRIWKTS